MSEVLTHPSAEGGPRATGKGSSGRRGRRRGVEIKPGTVKQARSDAGLSLAELERLVVTGDPEGALSAGEALLASERDPEVVARIRFQMSTAHLRLAQWVPARRLASTARAYFEQSGDMLMTAECLGNEASAAYMMQDPGPLSLA